MMQLIYLILLLLGAAFFIVAAVNKTVKGWNPVALGLLCWILVSLLQTMSRVS